MYDGRPGQAAHRGVRVPPMRIVDRRADRRLVIRPPVGTCDPGMSVTHGMATVVPDDRWSVHRVGFGAPVVIAW